MARRVSSRRRLRRVAQCTIATVALLSLVAEGRAADADAVAPLAPDAQRILRAIVADPPPPRLLNNQHYVVSDEHRPERFRPVLEGRGGVLLGVGTDQNYLFAGWARPELLLVVDFDQTVVDLHTAYRAFFLAAPDVETFIELWSESATERARSAVARIANSEAERRRIDYALRISRHLVHGRLTNLRARFTAEGVPTLLNDRAQYERVASLVRAGRVVAVRGDVTGQRTMRAVARATEQLGGVVRVLYLSNVEQYVRYSPQFRANVRALPVDDRSVVLRTYHQGPGRGYLYAVQQAAHFRAWLGRPEVKTLGDMMWRARGGTPGPLISLLGPPA